ncbi:MAG: ATPase domain-containing protein [Candidatus Bathyarchaeota archaeon]|jgi:DNA repair protein RadB|nr:ATPase domain-containing protein [Candidatus Bathyarchaeota archaeon]
MSLLQKISTGCRELDKFLEGGISFENVSLIYGEAETGKTTLAMQLAVNCAMQGYKTLFIDCDGTFSARRLSQIASKNFKDVAEQIILMKPNTFREQITVIDKLPEYVAKNFGLVIVDTLTSLYRVEIAEHTNKAFELNRELNRQMALLAQIAKTRKIAVIITSQVRSVFDEAYVSIEPVATRVLKFWADIIIALCPTENSQVIRAVLEKSQKGTQPITFQLKIEETGIHDYQTR